MEWHKLEASDWPSTTWKNIPAKTKWITLIQAVISYVNIRDNLTGTIVKARLGVPVRLKENGSYSWQNVANSNIDIVNTPIATDALFSNKNFKTELLASEEPYYGGFLKGCLSVQNRNAAGLTIYPFAFTADGLKNLSVIMQSAGVITAVRLYSRNEISAADSVVRSSALSNNYVSLTTGHKGIIYDISGYSTPTIFEGYTIEIVFPVTTTPTVNICVTGEV